MLLWNFCLTGFDDCYVQSRLRVNLPFRLNMTWMSKVSTSDQPRVDPTFHTSFIRSADQEWLDQVNLERKKEQLNAVSYETFEIVMDRLEKEWFDLVSSFALDHLFSFPS